MDYSLTYKTQNNKICRRKHLRTSSHFELHKDSLGKEKAGTIKEEKNRLDFIKIKNCS
jgi:hypothetical protein